RPARRPQAEHDRPRRVPLRGGQPDQLRRGELPRIAGPGRAAGGGAGLAGRAGPAARGGAGRPGPGRPPLPAHRPRHPPPTTPARAVGGRGRTPGYDPAWVRMAPTGEVIVTTGTCAHGQGPETTFAQIVADRLGVPPDQVRLRQGDPDLASYGWGTFASRSIV